MLTEVANLDNFYINHHSVETFFIMYSVKNCLQIFFITTLYFKSVHRYITTVRSSKSSVSKNRQKMQFSLSKQHICINKIDYVYTTQSHLFIREE